MQRATPPRSPDRTRGLGLPVLTAEGQPSGGRCLWRRSTKPIPQAEDSTAASRRAFPQGSEAGSREENI